MRPIARAIQSALRTLGIDQESTRALRADGDTLVVLVPTAHWAGEIRLRERDLLQALADRAPTSRIAHLRCVPSP